jgi:hypothetical protein
MVKDNDKMAKNRFSDYKFRNQEGTRKEAGRGQKGASKMLPSQWQILE